LRLPHPARPMLRARLVAAVAGAALLLFAALPAAATPATLKRSVENLTLWPFDVALSPVTAGYSIYRNMRDIDDSLGVRIAYPVPGYAWNVMVQVGAGVLRGVTGCLELVPGLILVPFSADMDPLYDPVEENSALVNYDTPVYRVKFGVDYTTPQ
jgi:hypothetical protein